MKKIINAKKNNKPYEIALFVKLREVVESFIIEISIKEKIDCIVTGKSIQHLTLNK